MPVSTTPNQNASSSLHFCLYDGCFVSCQGSMKNRERYHTFKFWKGAEFIEDKITTVTLPKGRLALMGG